MYDQRGGDRPQPLPLLAGYVPALTAQTVPQKIPRPRPTHLDLFSGIGGFALAARWAGFKTVQFVERDHYCGKILGQHWPKTPLHKDIKDFHGTHLAGRLSLVTGGFPCQPFSAAGKRRGTEDPRHLWPEMLRVIAECRPAWVCGENVANLSSIALDLVCSDLESIGYAVQPFNIEARAVGAVHHRARLWIVARDDRPAAAQDPFAADGHGDLRLAADDVSAGAGDVSDVFEPDGATDVQHPGIDGAGLPCRPVPLPGTPQLCRTDDGIPDLVDRIKALGNAIVPQVAYNVLTVIRPEIDAAEQGRQAANSESSCPTPTS